MRIAIARILVVLGVLFVVLSLLAAYIRFQALDNDTVRNTAGELIADDKIREQVAATLVDQLYANVDVAGELEQRLPSQTKPLAGPIAAGLREFSDRAANEMLERPRVQALWVESVARAHQRLINVLEDDTGPVSTENGAVVLDLQPLVVQLGERVAIIGRAAQQLPPDAGRIEILQADQLETAQDITQWLKFLGTWLWILPLVLWAIALWLARGRRRPLLRMIAIGSILAGLLVLVVRRVAGSYIVEDVVTSDTVRPAVQDAWEILTQQLRDGGLTLVGLGVIALFAVWLAGPTRSGVATRRFLAPYLARWEIAYGAAAALFLLLVWWSPTVQTTRVQLMLVAAVVLTLGVEVLRRETAREFPDPAPADIGGAVRRGLERMRGGGAEDKRVGDLERLSRLHQQGELSDAEFAAEKAKLVGE